MYKDSGKPDGTTFESKHESPQIPGLPQQVLFTVRETAAIFKVHPRTIERWIEDDYLTAIVLPGGKSLRISYQELVKVFSQTTT